MKINLMKLLGLLPVVLNACEEEENTDKPGPEKRASALETILAVGGGVAGTILEPEDQEKVGKTIDMGVQLLKLWKAF